jgi:hypothetical protein
MGGWVGGEVRARGEYRFSSLMKFKKKGEKYVTSPEKEKYFVIFMKSLLHRKKKNAPLFTTDTHTQTNTHTHTFTPIG